MKFGGIIEGARWIWIEGVTRLLRLEAGDFYLLSHGGPNCFASDVTAKPMDGPAFMEEHLEPDGVIRFNGGAALRLMHGDVARRWKVGDLAGHVGMSRTSFAERFKSLVGLAPLEYLTQWRMTIARAALRREDSNLATIAETIGYESDTAFSLAFKRLYGSGPGRYRARMRGPGMAA